ncbi:MAG: phytanoyl-CoA dioxygenase family protein [Candidatus Latescibacterota bacterium]|nr:phytanoyl-CoA dioxygenase family protein [Candidatus Latescibacterota bacterium]
MITPEEHRSFLEQGYLHVPAVLDPQLLRRIQSEFEEIWEAESSRSGRCNQLVLLRHRTFIDLIEHPPILDRHTAMFGRQTQLLQYDFLRQEPGSTFPLRAWHRDFSFPSDRPLSINTIVYLDPMDADSGPTYVVPGSHRGMELPPAESQNEPIEGEVAVYAEPGDAVFINSPVWHTGSCNQSNRLRRGIYMYYGYWWLKRYESEFTLPAACLERASERRLRLLGYQMPDQDLHIYDPELPFDFDQSDN